MPIGFHPFVLIIQFFFLLTLIIPWVIGFAWVMPDANRRGQPGLLWALLTIPLNWLAILGYLVARFLTTPAPR